MAADAEVRRKVYVIGFGLGNPALLTVAARDAIGRSGLVIGSRRLIEALGPCAARTLCLVRTEDIARALREAPEGVASVLMSGDVGLYSGASPLYGLLEGMEVEIIPGISSLAYLCAKLQVPWQDVHVVSAHGRPHNVVGAVQTHATTFVLTGGTATPAALCTQLAERGLGEVRVCVGERLSYPDERLVQGTAARLANQQFDGLAAMLVTNDHPLSCEVAAPHLPDDAFARGKVPMTKEEVRELAICKLRIRPAHVVWDVGAGTGSVSVEAARAAREGQVYAIEHSEEACALLARNKERFALTNLTIVHGSAPEALAGLPAPDRVFVGGSSGKLRDIVATALVANPGVRICLTAITLETLTQALACVNELDLQEAEIVQLSVAKAHEVGSLHMLRANNPVFLISAQGAAAEEAPTDAEAASETLADGEGRRRGVWRGLSEAAKRPSSAAAAPELRASLSAGVSEAASAPMGACRSGFPLCKGDDSP